MPRGATEPLFVCVVEMFVFALAAVGVQIIASDLDAQPALVTATVIGQVMSSAVLALALMVYAFWEGADPYVFVMVRAAWQWALASSVNAKVYATIVFTSRGASKRHWTALLFQTQTYEEDNFYRLSALTGVGFACVSVVALLQTVFYNNCSKGIEAYKNYTGRFAEMLAFCALLVQYSTERELDRLCTTSLRKPDVPSCRLDLLGGTASADYSMFIPLATTGALLLAVDVGLVIAHARLEVRASSLLVMFYTFLAVLPCVGYFVVVFVVLQHTTLPYLVWLLVVGGMLVLARLQRVVFAVSRHGLDWLRPVLVADDNVEAKPSATGEQIRLKGTAQRRGKTKSA